MPLVNLQTNLKSLGFGNDRPGLTDSGQPYITTPIPGINEPIPGNELNNDDFLLRGGINGVRDTATDLLRLSKFFNDRNSPAGSLFTVKQNMLSRISVRTQASGIGLNEGVYTPLNTLAQAGISIEGGHTPKQGLLPFRGPNTYLKAIGEQILENQGSIALSNLANDPTWAISLSTLGPVVGSTALAGVQQQLAEIPNNRLIQLNEVKRKGTKWVRDYRKHNQISKNPTEVLAYGGGPNSIAGIGKTHIKIGTDNLGSPLTTGISNPKLYNGNIGFSIGPQIPEVNRKYIRFSYPTLQDFRKEKLKDAKGVSTIMGIAPSYNPDNSRTIDGPRSSRINYTSPGQRGNVIDYTAGKLDSNGDSIGPVDRINALPIYRTTANGLSDSIAENDLIKFRIGAINNSNPKEKDYVNFRAFIDSFSDSYNASWNSQKYMGRGENFYKYDSFTRDINLSFTVAAQSREEIMIMYRKLNFLVSNLAPDYTDAGYMAGPLVQLTLGGWCYELPGFIKSMTLDVPQESPWEIGIPIDKEDKDVGGIKFRDKKVKEMPMICRITGFTFTPIHKFRPAKQTLNRGKGGKSEAQAITLQDENTYGPERYLSLANGKNRRNIDYDSYSQIDDNL